MPRKRGPHPTRAHDARATSSAPPPAQPRTPAFATARSVAGTSLLYVGLVLLLTGMARTPLADRLLLAPFRMDVARLASRILNLIGIAAVAHGTSIVSPRLSVDIVNECTGVEAIILLVPAMLAFPARWSAKGVGVGCGLAVMAALNLLRVVSLCYVGSYSSAALHAGHLYVWPVVVIVVALGTLLVWVERIAVPHYP